MRPPAERGGAAHLIGPTDSLILTSCCSRSSALILPQHIPHRRQLQRRSSSNQSIPAILALGAMIPIVTGKFDLSIGYGLGLAHVVGLQLIVDATWPWPLRGLVVVIGGVARRRDQRSAGRIRADRLLHRHAGHRQRAVRDHRRITNGARIVPGRRRAVRCPSPTSTTPSSPDVPVVRRVPPGRWPCPVAPARTAAAGPLPLRARFKPPRRRALIGIPTKRYAIYAFACSAWSPGSRECCSPPSSRSETPASAWTTCCQPSSARCWAPPPSSPAGRTPSEPWLQSPSWPSAWPASASWAPNSGSRRCSTASPCSIAVGLAGYSARRKLRAGAVAAPPPNLPAAGDAGPPTPGGPSTGAGLPTAPATTAV